MNIKKYIAITLSIVCISCSDLERYPLTAIGEPQFWATAEDAVLGVNGIYNVLASGYMYGHFMRHADALGDNAYSEAAYYGFLEISENRGFDPSSTWVDRVWSKSYEGIVRANEVVQNIPEIAMDENNRKRLLAEARFLRALFYFHLTNLYGDVPLVLTKQSIAESLVPRDDKATVLAQIFEDLTFAIANLPESYGASDVGRATKGAALALKSRVHLYNKQYTEAISAANDVISLGYGLLPAADYKDMFLPAKENNAVESIFEVQFLSNTGSDIGSSFNSVSGAIPDFGFAPYMPIQELVDAYEPGDIRKDVTILQEGQSFAGVEFNPSRITTGYALIKGVIPDPLVRSDGDANFVVIRFAEILLNLAEAENELNGPTGIVYDAINKIRNRVGLGDLPAGMSKEEMRAAIKKERRLELAFEGHRYFDLLRYGAEDLRASMESVTSVEGHERFYEDKLLLWPIPQGEVNVNPNLLPQNPGW